MAKKKIVKDPEQIKLKKLQALRAKYIYDESDNKTWLVVDQCISIFLGIDEIKV